MNHSSTDINELLTLIERYFDCSLSDDEEKQLREVIAVTEISHPAVDEARALMGFRRPAPSAAKAPARRSRGTIIRAGLSIAAAVALIITIGIHVINPSAAGQDDYTCIAYVNGAMITDEDQIMDLIAQDLREFNDQAVDTRQSIRKELGDIAPIIDDIESDTSLPEL